MLWKVEFIQVYYGPTAEVFNREDMSLQTGFCCYGFPHDTVAHVTGISFSHNPAEAFPEFLTGVSGTPT